MSVAYPAQVVLNRFSHVRLAGCSAQMCYVVIFSLTISQVLRWFMSDISFWDLQPANCQHIKKIKP